MRTMEQSSRGQAGEGQGSALWHGARASVTGPVLEVAEEVDLLPDFEELLRGGPREEWRVPGPEGLLG
jgi:hypothetical protein